MAVDVGQKGEETSYVLSSKYASTTVHDAGCTSVSSLNRNHTDHGTFRDGATLRHANINFAHLIRSSGLNPGAAPFLPVISNGQRVNAFPEVHSCRNSALPATGSFVSRASPGSGDVPFSVEKGEAGIAGF